MLYTNKWNKSCDKQQLANFWHQNLYPAKMAILRLTLKWNRNKLLKK